jgi:hypothetical protein
MYGDQRHISKDSIFCPQMVVLELTKINEMQTFKDTEKAGSGQLLVVDSCLTAE